MDMEGFRDKADDALTQGEEEVDERTGGRFDEQTDRAAEEVRERGGSVLGDQQADEGSARGRAAAVARSARWCGTWAKHAGVPLRSSRSTR